MRVLVLGAGGFIGTHIVNRLLSLGYEVTGYGRSLASTHSKYKWVQGDFLDGEKLNFALDGVDQVIHCISTTVPATSSRDPVYDVESNLVGTLQLLNMMKEKQIKKLVYFSSGGTVYGDAKFSPVSETAALNPISSYGATKVGVEKFIGVAEADWGLKPLIVRPSNPYGELQDNKGGAQGLISTVLNNVLDGKATPVYGKGDAVRDYIYVKDLVDFVCCAIERNVFGVFNAGCGVGLSVLEVIEVVERVVGASVAIDYRESRGFDVREIVLDISKAYEKCLWRPMISIEEGVGRQYEWLKGTRNGSSNR